MAIKRTVDCQWNPSDVVVLEVLPREKTSNTWGYLKPPKIYRACYFAEWKGRLIKWTLHELAFNIETKDVKEQWSWEFVDRPANKDINHPLVIPN